MGIAGRNINAVLVVCMIASTCLVARGRLDLVSKVGQETYPTGETTVQLTIGVLVSMLPSGSDSQRCNGNLAVF